MPRLSFAVLLCTVALLVATPAGAGAGGWSSVALDVFPWDVVAGQQLTIGFVVRQHGTTPIRGLNPTVEAQLGRERIVVQAREDRPSDGHYTAQITLPRAGTWKWGIDAFEGMHPMPDLQVAPSGAATDAAEPSLDGLPTWQLSAIWPPALGMLLLLGLALTVRGPGGRLWHRRDSHGY